MLLGLSILGSASGQPGRAPFKAMNPATGLELDPPFHSASPEEVDQAVRRARAAAPLFAACDGARRAALLRAIARELELDAAELVPRVMAETALPEGRVRGELDRTCFQLRLFATVADEGSWVDARLDTPDPARHPLPRPDLRSMLRPLGPVAVFGASNFPLAFSVAGGDTASALAGGCPVVVKAHPLHPGSSERVGRAISRAVAETGLPQDVFSLLFDAGHQVGAALVQHPGIRAVGFTGSFRGGQALLGLASARSTPIPVYAEMGSGNPVVMLEHALSSRPEAIAQTLAASITQGVGQFCTCPGLILAVEGSGLQRFRDALAAALATVAPAPMLGEGLARAYRDGIERLKADPSVHGHLSSPSSGSLGAPAFLETNGAQLILHPELAEEIFGPGTLLVACRDDRELEACLQSLPGQLTATLWMEPGDLGLATRLLPHLQELAGRVLFNGAPTGVEVGHAMVHGGPWPATSAPHATSVGTLAIRRWARPVCFQNVPEALLPPELHHANPLGLWRQVDGAFGKH
ncbi:MAG TPA: aldehyde dehydrogenase (NADP(+)) [Holophagaceae bacterium]|jgi:alpha-ketoglutaric semialdehyde dehydrogenase|nr:aldehyde dehydrogenase (NADP(+)) [Holophagaceae bacterium]